MAALQRGRCGIAEYLISKGADVNPTGSVPVTPLGLAVGQRNAALVKAILSLRCRA